MTRLSLILPTYNEVDNVIPLLDELQQVLDLKRDEIIVVDDNSPDGTADCVRNYAQTFHLEHAIKLISRHSKERGLSLAVVDGFEAASGKYLGAMDADLSHDAKIIPRMIASLDGGHVVAIGSRRVPGGGAVHWPALRRAASNLATTLTRLFLHIPVQDPMSGFFLIRRELFERSRARLHPRGYKILLEILVCSSERNFVEIPYIFKDRRQGYSKMSFPVLYAFLKQCASLSLMRLKKK